MGSARVRPLDSFAYPRGQANIQWQIPQHITTQADERKEERGWRQPLTGGDDEFLRDTLAAGRKQPESAAP